MPLVSFAFTGCVKGHAPSAPASTKGRGAVSGAGAGGTVCASGTEGRGIGGNGNGAVSQEIARCCAAVCACHHRHPPYASPARIPVWSSRFDPLRMTQFSHAHRRGAEVTLTQLRVYVEWQHLCTWRRRPRTRSPQRCWASSLHKREHT